MLTKPKMVKKPQKKQNSGGGLSSNLIKKPIKKWFPLFMGPTIICFCIGFIWPFIHGIYLSFCQFTIITKTKFVGFSNYIRALTDPSFIHAFWYTALYTVVSVVLINLFAFLFALALTQKMKGSNLFRTVFFMPNLIGGIVLSYIWSMIFNGVLSKYGTSILLDEKLGFWGLVILMCWQQIGYMMIIYIAGLQAIPGDMLEAAEIDGASRWQTLIRITIPNVMTSITICTFLTLSNGFKLFDQNLALTGGLPISYVNGEQVSASEMLALNIYSTYMMSGKSARGTAQAKAVLFFILVAAIGLLQLKVTRKKEVQQ